MKTKAVRIYGKEDLRLEEFELPKIKSNEILGKVISDSICMSSHKLAMQGDMHKRVRGNLASTPVIIGHEFCGDLIEVGADLRGKFTAGQKFAIQPALNYKSTLWAPGYSYPYIGGAATYIIIPAEVMEMNCLLEYSAPAYFLGSLSEPMSCIIGAFHAQYHSQPGSYIHEMGITKGGGLALLGSVGPMGLGAIDYAIHADRKPKTILVTDINQNRLDRAASMYTVKEAARYGINLHYVNTSTLSDPVSELTKLQGKNKYNDVFVFAPVKSLVELGASLLGQDGCLNFFAGPTDPNFSAMLNFYNVHYESHHLVATSGGNTSDIAEAISMMATERLNPAAMITHIGGLDAVIDTTLHLDTIPGGKKLIYTHKKLKLTALADLEKEGNHNPFFRQLYAIVHKNNGLWSAAAEEYLLANAPEV